MSFIAVNASAKCGKLMNLGPSVNHIYFSKFRANNFSTHSNSVKSHPCNLCLNNVQLFGVQSILGPNSAASAALPLQYYGCRNASGRGGGIFTKLYESLKEEFKQSKEVQSSIKKFREETSKLDDSDALKSARKKYEQFEEETGHKTKILKEKLDDVSGKMKEGYEEIRKSELGQKTSDIASSVGQTVKSAGESVAKGGKYVMETEAFKSVGEAAEIVKQNIDEELSRARLYRSPSTIKGRTQFQMFATKAQAFDAETQDINESELRVELHKDAKWHARWQDFRDNNPMMNRVFDLKNQYDESENPVVAGTRYVTIKMTNILSGMFGQNEVSKVMSEIQKVDPNFTISRFNDVCHKIILPHIVEALFHANLKVLEDWCTTSANLKLQALLEQVTKQGHRFHSKVMDVGEPDLHTAVMDQAASPPQPILVMQFEVQAICTIRDKNGSPVGMPEGSSIIGGGLDGSVDRYHFVVALTRDMEDIDPISSWRLGDMEVRKLTLAF